MSDGKHMHQVITFVDDVVIVVVTDNAVGAVAVLLVNDTLVEFLFTFFFHFFLEKHSSINFSRILAEYLKSWRERNRKYNNKR